MVPTAVCPLKVVTIPAWFTMTSPSSGQARPQVFAQIRETVFLSSFSLIKHFFKLYFILNTIYICLRCAHTDMLTDRPTRSQSCLWGHRLRRLEGCFLCRLLLPGSEGARGSGGRWLDRVGTGAQRPCEPGWGGVRGPCPAPPWAPADPCALRVRRDPAPLRAAGGSHPMLVVPPTPWGGARRGGPAQRLVWWG